MEQAYKDVYKAGGASLVAAGFVLFMFFFSLVGFTNISYANSRDAS